MIVLHGLPAVGKLTVARELTRMTGYKLFHNHLVVDLVGSLFDFGSRPFVELREMIWLAVFRRAAEERLPGLIFTFAHDRTVRDTFIAEMEQAVRSAGGSVAYVELRCSDEELERRLVEPSRRQFGKLSALEQFRELKAAGAFKTDDMPKGLVIETTGMSAAETAAKIVHTLTASSGA